MPVTLGHVRVRGATFFQGWLYMQPHPCLFHRVTQGLQERRETLGGPAPQDLSAPEDET